MRAASCMVGVICLAALSLGGCEKNAPSALDPRISDTRTPPSASLTDPCAIALTRHPGSDRADQEIILHQQHARQAEKPVPHLERLGWAFVAKARLSFDPGFYTLAEQCALCIEMHQPHSLEALLLRGHVLHQLHRFRQAEVLARELVARRGLWFDYGLLGDVLMEQGQLDAAIKAYQQMMDQKPGPQAYSRAAQVRWLRGDLPGAIELMRMSTASRDADSGAWAHTRLALYELQAERGAKATAHISAALALLPDYAPALLARGRVLLAEGKPAEAVIPLARATQLNPLPEYQWALIEALRASGKANQAAAVELQLMKRGPITDPRTCALYLATTRQDLGTALRLAEGELKVRTDVFTLDAVAWALFAAGRHQQAHEFSRRALAEGTRDARLFYHAGVIAAALGRNGEARRWFEKAAALQQMLLPSEREQLARTFGTIPAQTSYRGTHRIH